ncbi:hypothetical protein ABZ791_10820 [Streptomyces huasconensis]|uniref:CHAP domain-containing protein n=1 Tax=Streptomyces huasconensis TaxID=1854574 RepID=A0ABV3M751_9ACTN
MKWFTDRGRWNWHPATGSQVFYGPSGGDHTGIIIAYDATFIWAVEANTSDNGSTEGDGVYIRKRRRSDATVYGYGYPAYAEGIITADASKKGVSGYRHEVAHSGPGPAELKAGAVAVNNLVAETATVNGATHTGRTYIQQNDSSSVALEIIAATSTAPQMVLIKDADGVTRFEITAAGTSIHRALAAFVSNLQIGSASADAGGGVGVVGIKNAATEPTTNAVSGGVLYAKGGALLWRGSNGTVTTIAPA